MAEEMKVPMRPLGRSGVKVSELCLGTMTFGDRTDDAEAERIYRRARSAGINFVDTADVYSEGRSEKVLGRLIAEERDQIVLASKIANPTGSGPNDAGLSYARVLREVPKSLERLGIDHLDILYLHKEDHDTPLEETVRALADLHGQGLIRYVGVSNHRAWRVVQLARLCEDAGIGRPVICQPYYHALYRVAEVELLPACHDLGLSVFPYSPAARGVLTGKYAAGGAPPADSRAAVSDKRLLETELRPETLAAAQKVVDHARGRGADPTGFAIRWVLANPYITGAVVGPRTVAQLEAYLTVLDVAWSAADEAAVDSVVPKGSTAVQHYVDPAYPIEGRPTGG